jgi:hypothetical protein
MGLAVRGGIRHWGTGSDRGVSDQANVGGRSLRPVRNPTSACSVMLHRCRRSPAVADPSEAGAPVVDAGRSGGEGHPRRREASFPCRHRPCGERGFCRRYALVAAGQEGQRDDARVEAPPVSQND